MKQKNNKQEDKKPKNSSSREKSNKELIPEEKFNTGSHTPSSMRNVGPGYDDTGMSDYSKSKEIDAEKEKGSNKKKGRSEDK